MTPSGREPTARFSDRAEDYARFRPGYPPEAIDAVLAGLADPSRLLAADVGAGTGISARLLADRGVRVTAVEPNPEMRAAASPHSLVSWQDGTAERTGLSDSSVDLVLSAQAFHWFRVDEALAEFARVCRPRARLALLMNEGAKGDPATDGYYALAKPLAAADTAVKKGDWVPSGKALARAGFAAPRFLEFAGGQALDREGLLGRARSASYVPKEGPAFEAVVRGLAALHARFADAAGLVRIAYRTRVLLADREGR